MLPWLDGVAELWSTFSNVAVNILATSMLGNAIYIYADKHTNKQIFYDLDANVDQKLLNGKTQEKK